TIHSAARSFTEAPGFMNSHLPQISQPAAALAPLSRTSGVLPIRSSEFSRTGAIMPVQLGRHHRGSNKFLPFRPKAKLTAQAPSSSEEGVGGGGGARHGTTPLRLGCL